MSVNEKMTAIADKIRHYTYETEKLTLDDMANKIEMVNLSGYNNGFTEGMQSGYTTGYDEGKMQGVDEGYIAAIEEINPELLEIISIQESYIYPTILFYFDRTEYHVRESEAYWTDKISFKGDWMDQHGLVWNNNGYAKWESYLIVDSQNNYVKYNDIIKNLEQYFSTTQFRFFIQCDDGNKYTIEFDMYGETNTDLMYLSNAISGFEMIMDENYNPIGYYFTPENSEKKYYISHDYNHIELEDTINATLVEGGNE